MINQCYKDPVARKHMVNKIGQVLRLEIKAMCSDRVSSILQSMNSDNLKTFRWDLVLSELKLHAPMLMDILFSCTKTKFPRKNQTGIVCFVASILFKFRYARMDAVQKVLSLILYAGHCGKQVHCVDC